MLCGTASPKPQKPKFKRRLYKVTAKLSQNYHKSITKLQQTYYEAITSLSQVLHKLITKLRRLNTEIKDVHNLIFLYKQKQKGH